MSIWDEDPAPKSKPRWVGLTIGFVVFLCLVAGAVAGGEVLARDAASGLVTGPVSSALGAEDASGVEVGFGDGFLLAQLVSGSVDEVHASADPVTIAGGSAALSLVATGVPLSTPVVAATVRADLGFDSDGVAGLAATLAEGATGLRIDGDLLLLSAPGPGESVLELALAPSVGEDGSLVLTPTAATIDGQEVALETLAAGAYGAAGTALAAPRSLCVAQFLPAGLDLTSAQVAGGRLALALAGEKVSLSGGSKGACVAPETPVAEEPVVDAPAED